MTAYPNVKVAPNRSAEDLALGYVVGKIRNVAGYSQAEFAPLVPIDRDRLARIECGRQPAKLADLIELEDAFLRLGCFSEQGYLQYLVRRAIPLVDELIATKARDRRAA